MRGLSDTLSRLSSLRAIAGNTPFATGDDRLTDFEFSPNPGALRARCHVPPGLVKGAPLVVALHGCTQNAAGYDSGTGWSHLADQQGFAVLFPEQQRGNNANLCFNWFLPADTSRDCGEAASIRAMVETMVTTHALDRSRIFVTGLSAGGAMTSAMLATYPDVFAAGAIVAGLAYGAAATMPEAFDAMRGHRRAIDSALGQAVRDATSHTGPWPRISVWHGMADLTVASSNGDAIVDQWRDVHGLAREPSRTEGIDGHTRRVWCDASGREVIESFGIARMGHGLPLNPARSAINETPGPFMLDVGISATVNIARFWGLVSAQPRQAVVPASLEAPRPRVDPAPATRIPRPPLPAARSASGVGKVIEDALRTAGLMK